MYRLFTAPISNQEFIIRLTDNAYIPVNEENTDYQVYLKWQSEGNTPEPVENN